MRSQHKAHNAVSDGGITHLAQFRQLELELVGPILGVLQGFFETLRTVVAFNLFLELADAALMFLGLRPELIHRPAQELDLVFL